MVTKRMIAEVVLNRLNGGSITRDSKITLRQAMFAVSEARNYIIQQHLLQVYKAFGIWEMPFGVLSEYEITAENSKRGWLVRLPKSPLNLINDLGIYEVIDVDCPEEDYVPRKVSSGIMFRGLAAEEMEGEKSYIPANGMLRLYNTNFSEAKDNKVRVTMVTNSHDFDDREDFRLPPELETLVTDMATQKLGVQVQMPQDNLLDGTPNQQTQG